MGARDLVVTTKAFVIGHPIKHSRSPLIHGTWISQHGLDASYEAIDVAPDQLPAFFKRLRRGEFAGGNVTIPHKQDVFALCDSVDPLATSIGAVNTLVVQDGQVHGTNTDYLGFLGNLDAEMPGWSERLDTAIVLGAGGAARAILVALQSRNVGSIVLLNRTRETAEELAAELAGSISVASLNAFNDVAPLAGLVVNTSSIGMHGSRFEGLDLATLPSHALVTDIVYTPLQTPLLAEAEARGLAVVDGLGMLLHQAVPGFEAWFGVRPQVDKPLRTKVEATLGH
ncbi:shikimate dehydrogenase [Devosia submarina]|uniref:shikimate dehydrogenase n=1 Tax=Devosia submarina TaxID=1173082 RepID=UPI000D3C754E|nr:shikimate dehydrogenase [Devosia submarina]